MSVEFQAKLDDRTDPHDPARSASEGVRRADTLSESDDDYETVPLRLEISPELDDAIDRMADDLEVSRADAFVHAMTLLRMTLDAKKLGKRVCITDEDLNVETELTGFGRFDIESDFAPARGE